MHEFINESKYLLLLALTVPFIAGLSCSTTKHKPLPTTESVDIGRYLGRWHEIARYPHSFEKGCENVTADYSLREDGDIKVLNSCTLPKKGDKVKVAEGKAWVVDSTTNAKLKVRFFWPFSGDYWILYLDNDYNHVIIGEPDRDYFWILARTPKIKRELFDSLVAKAEALGYERSKLEFPGETIL